MTNSRVSIGRLFEREVENLIKKSNCKVINESEITRIYGKLAFGTDHILYGYNKIIFFQHKWRTVKPGLVDANHFINSINYISENYKDKLILGLFVTKTIPTLTMIERFNEENKKDKLFISYIYYGETDDNFEPILNKIHNELHSHGIFLYDNDGTTIMSN